jgi:hypothetical protein
MSEWPTGASRNLGLGGATLRALGFAFLAADLFAALFFAAEPTR